MWFLHWTRHHPCQRSAAYCKLVPKQPGTKFMALKQLGGLGSWILTPDHIGRRKYFKWRRRSWSELFTFTNFRAAGRKAAPARLQPASLELGSGKAIAVGRDVHGCCCWMLLVSWIFTSNSNDQPPKLSNSPANWGLTPKNEDSSKGWTTRIEWDQQWVGIFLADSCTTDIVQ